VSAEESLSGTVLVMTIDLLTDLLDQARARYRFVTLESFDFELDGEEALCWQVRLSHVGACSDDVFVEGGPDEAAASVLARALAAPDPSDRQGSGRTGLDRIVEISENAGMYEKTATPKRTR
jgi:hypothetical protein